MSKFTPKKDMAFERWYKHWLELNLKPIGKSERNWKFLGGQYWGYTKKEMVEDLTEIHKEPMARAWKTSKVTRWRL